MITHLLMVAALGIGAVQPAPAIIHDHESTAQMYRNYMETGSIYYSNSHASGSPVHIVKRTDQPLLPAIQHEAAQFAGIRKTATR
ncbi:hypothetical protein BBC27_08770 [Acidithiobacillus ferrivorans]|uniref:Uncharacterized protein n=1 Tax=Acidithiobacillus ferrivorans TaxID=160808 RepID=A0A1B9BZW8_9PROT|nr:hypothetical protein [Acidithiobacillus ferrivorans]OCB03276.1 hypothetical protein BBC27_08770 [Acidithiobacillus ferrivorans]